MSINRYLILIPLLVGFLCVGIGIHALMPMTIGAVVIFVHLFALASLVLLIRRPFMEFALFSGIVLFLMETLYSLTFGQYSLAWLTLILSFLFLNEYIFKHKSVISQTLCATIALVLYHTVLYGWEVLLLNVPFSAALILGILISVGIEVILCTLALQFTRVLQEKERGLFYE